MQVTVIWVFLTKVQFSWVAMLAAGDITHKLLSSNSGSGTMHSSWFLSHLLRLLRHLLTWSQMVLQNGGGVDLTSYEDWCTLLWSPLLTLLTLTILRYNMKPCTLDWEGCTVVLHSPGGTLSCHVHPCSPDLINSQFLIKCSIVYITKCWMVLDRLRMTEEIASSC